MDVVANSLTFSIAVGLGRPAYVLIKVMAGRRTERSSTLIGVALPFAIKFALL